jgi:hypothetical protein
MRRARVGREHDFTRARRPSAIRTRLHDQPVAGLERGHHGLTGYDHGIEITKGAQRGHADHSANRGQACDKQEPTRARRSG